MRTVHETEALRPSDPVPKSMQFPGGGPAGKSSKLKIVLKTSQPARDDDAMDESSANGDGSPIQEFTPMTTEQGFTSEELKMPLERLHKLCRLQQRWAEQDGIELGKEIKRWEEEYKKEWLEKEVLLDQVVQGEIGWHDRRRAVLSGAADVQLAGVPIVASNGSADKEGQTEKLAQVTV